LDIKGFFYIKEGVSKNGTLAPTSVVFFETPSKQKNEITLVNIPSTYTKKRQSFYKNE
jgi:hypothetical protein